jgi:putative sigma-54 modulation protein
MNINVQAVKFTLDEDQRVYIDKKMERIKYAEDLITDVLLNIKFDRQFYCDCTVNFRWGGNAHVKAEDFDITISINKLMDVLDLKIKKEKDKIQETRK